MFVHLRKNNNHYIYSFIGLTGIKGNVITFPQDISNLCYELPRLPKDLPFVIVESKDERLKPLKLQIRPGKVLAALEYLADKNPFYKNIKINKENLKAYEDADGHVENVTVLHKDWEPTLEDIEMPMSDKDHLLEDNLQGDFPLPDTILPHPVSSEDIKTLTQKAINLVGEKVPDSEEKQEEIQTTFALPKRGNRPLSEFQAGYYSKTFPHLFPNGDGDYRRVSCISFYF